ncbi:MFS general substrate transporter [Trametes versicolor FP-101664 SS1]|uniref:MFS general substrate transporter n=1 Tax=Trametes versicolor (strain FP-101664) TaxID=717944 RepID=R7S7V3_TRAVS|nr:MFS general substrate transporter [Trametes versicolor FP-101664 SS1]EIW52066.1 MFS general substrate transporter [Trametes versicolor FP-101664 SS1]
MFNLKVPAWYTSPMAQVVVVGFTCFATVGMFSAVSNLGAGGLSDITLSDTSQGVLYGLFAVTGLISGGINNLLGPRLTLFLGTLGYAVYVGSLWCYQTRGTGWFVIFAGAIEGISAALLWSAQGSIMMSYPLEKDKGKAFAIFWAIFQFGSFIGSIIALAINIESGKLSAVSTSTYIAFLIIIFIGVASSFLVLPPNKVIRSDGTIVKLEAFSKPHEEVVGMLRLFKDWRMIALVPMFFASNYFYAYQSAVNTARFDGATRALNATLEGAGAIVGALLIGYFCLDLKWFHRRTRGYLGLATVTVIVIVVWSVGLAWQVTFTRADLSDANRISYHDADYKGKGALYFFYFFSDACYQALAYWIMSALSNDPFTLARYAGLYKALQSAGEAGSFGMDAVSTPFLNEQLASWILMLVSFPLAWLVLRTVKETNYGDEEVVYVDDIKTQRAEAGTAPEAARGDSVEKGSDQDVAVFHV